MSKTVLITGASSGFGQLTARLFQQNGWNVVATMRSPEKETELTELDNVLVNKLDVTDVGSIEKSVAEGLERFGSIDVLVNNAAYGGNALFEQSSGSSIRKMYETNVFGVMNVTRTILPIMRRRKSGCIINVTSMAGTLGVPTASVYCSTKFAVEGLSQAMAFECKPFNVMIKTVAPGAYPTTGFNSSSVDELSVGGDELSRYATGLYEHMQGLHQETAKQLGKESDPQEVADKIYECATSDTPVHNPVGADAQMLVGMIEGMSKQEFLNQIEEMVMPKS